jgi:hypothetical protein
MPVNYSDYYKKLAEKQAFSEDEIVALLKHAEHFEKSTAYLASCHAATAEGLPKSTSKSVRSRMLAICKVAVELLQGRTWAIKHPSRTQWELERCERVVAQLERDTLEAQTKTKPKAGPSAGGM